MTAIAKKNDGIRPSEEEARRSEERKMLERILKLRPTQQKRILELAELHRNATSTEEATEIAEVLAEILFCEPGDLNATDINDERSADNGKVLTDHRNYVAKQIKKQRQSLKMSQEELAGKAGIPQSHVSRLEIGQHAPTYRTIEKLAQALGVAPSVLDPGFDV